MFIQKSHCKFLLLFIFVQSLVACGNKEGKTEKREEKVDLVAMKKQLEKIRTEINADAKEKNLNELVERRIRNGFNGSILIAQKGIVLVDTAAGYANLTDKKKNTPSSQFQLASISKTFTSIAIMQLVEAGKVNLDYEIQVYFPKFPYKGITIRSLLSHRSGLPYYEYSFDKTVRYEKKYLTNQEIIKWFEEANPAPAIHNLPDHYFAYNNTNFAVLAAIVEKACNCSYQTYVKKNIFDPLEMKDSFVQSQQNDTLFVKNRTYGYQYGRKLPFDFYDNIVGDKGVFSSSRDLFKWYQALKEAKIVSKESLKEIFSPRSFEFPGLRNYGYGFRLWLNSKQQTDYIYHTGWWKGYNTIFFFDLKKDFVIILLSNKLDKSVYQIRDLIDILEEGKVSTLENDILE
ncbi:MAG: serine hydrolase domain-containing protein [Spirosomataceae bacterium]